MDRTETPLARPLQTVELPPADIAAAIFAYCMSEFVSAVDRGKTPGGTRETQKRVAAVVREAIDKIAGTES